jgi:DNA polymerase I
MTEKSHTLYLIDVSSFIFRAFFAIRALHNSRGEPTNAVYGVATMLARLADEAKPEYLAVIYDSKEPSFRKEIYPEYKANRSAPPEDLAPQFGKIEQLIRCMGIHSYRKSGSEADDLIASLASAWSKRSPENRVVIVTGDKDLMQLVDDRILVWDTMNNKYYRTKEVEEKFGVKPGQIRDYLALVGDSSDNIPGVPGIGPKTAADLLKQFGTLDSVLQAAVEGKVPGKKAESIRTHIKDAEISAKLATLHSDLPLDIDMEALKYQFHVREECLSLLRELDFHSLAKKWGGEVTPSGVSAVTSTANATTNVLGRTDFRTINTEQALHEMIQALELVSEFGFDVETTSLNPREAELVGIALCYDPLFGCYIPVGHRGTHVPQLPKEQVLRALRPFLESPKYKKVGQNLKYDWSVLRELGLKPRGIGADTMVAAYILAPEGRHSLESLAAQYLGYGVKTYEEVCGKGKDQICFDQVPVDLATQYSAEDAWVAVKLWEVLKQKLQQDQLMEIFVNVDLPLVEILVKMECQGVCIDEAWLQKLSVEFNKEMRAIEERIQAYTRGPVNLNSPKQLAVLLFEELKLPVQAKTKTGLSTDAKVLETLAPLHEVPRLLLEYREISKLKGTYVDPLPQLRDPKSGRIHASFHQTVTATGRLSSSNPNLQNIPIRSDRGQKIRRAFLPLPGNVLLSADYSQIELRLLAHMSGDSELVASFQKDEDVHSRTASELFSVSPQEVSDHQRSIAKAINFGLMYGKTAFGLSQELRISRREAQEVIDRYFSRYHRVKQFLDQQVLQAKERGWTETLLGRKRYLPDIRSQNYAVRTNAERIAMNAPLQGTAADLMKLAMIKIDYELERRSLKSKLIIQVHDEVVLDCPKTEAQEVQALVVEAMEGAMKLSVPLKVNSAVGENWLEL